MRFLTVLVILLLLGCGSSSKKQYPPLDSVAKKVDIKTLWVAKVGRKSFLENRQHSISLGRSQVFLADAKGNITALDQESGNKIWTKPLGAIVSSGPTAEGNLLFVGTNEALFYALDINSGDIVWEKKVSSEVLSAPAITEKYLYLQTIDGKLFALEKKTGKKVWVDSREVPALTLRGTSTPLVLDSIIIAGFANGKLAALDATTGKRLWETAITVPSGRTDLQRMIDIDGPIQADDNQVYVVTYQGRVAAVSKENGRTAWSREMSSFNGVVLDGQQLFLTDLNGHVWAIDKKTGATMWRQDKLADRDVTGAVVFQDMVVVADGAGYVHWLSREDGSFLYQEHLLDTYNGAFHDFGDDQRKESDFGVTSILISANDRLFVRNNMGALSVFQMPAAKIN